MNSMIASPAQPAVKNSAPAELASHFVLLSGEAVTGWNQDPQVPFVPGVAIGWAGKHLSLPIAVDRWANPAYHPPEISTWDISAGRICTDFADSVDERKCRLSILADGKSPVRGKDAANGHCPLASCVCLQLDGCPRGPAWFRLQNRQRLADAVVLMGRGKQPQRHGPEHQQAEHASAAPLEHTRPV